MFLTGLRVADHIYLGECKKVIVRYPSRGSLGTEHTGFDEAQWRKSEAVIPSVASLVSSQVRLRNPTWRASVWSPERGRHKERRRRER